ncbi:hypothetical protein A4A49_00481 [Nicotiana attenuata]|uniref:Uncharacterized protein n=1 Tax=Nicotiana attenuata TaxID=49451 RepID=A0A1J6J302_NICAT|nr:hypothetical protein A4A49_00481 [Nicotiana attenuata]
MELAQLVAEHEKLSNLFSIVEKLLDESRAGFGIFQGNRRTATKEAITELTERITEDGNLGLGSGKVRSITEILSKTPGPEKTIGEINTPTNRPVLQEKNANVTPVVMQQKARNTPMS